MKNPPAFPSSAPINMGTSDGSSTDGMSLLDYYAGLAMQGVLANSETTSQVDRFRTTKNLKTNDVVAALAYEQARAMLEERAKPENQL